MSKINDNIVLLLNKVGQAIETKTPAQAFCMMATGAAVAHDVSGENWWNPVKFEEWMKLPVRESDDTIMTQHGAVRIPRVIQSVTYASVPVKTPQFNLPNLREEFGGRDAYTGELVDPKDGSCEHVRPESLGGKRSWDNCVYAHRQVNSKRGNKPLHKAGLKLRQKPRIPRPRAKAESIPARFPEWVPFVSGRKKH